MQVCCICDARANAGQKKEVFHKNKYIQMIGNSVLSLIPSREAKNKSIDAIEKMGLTEKLENLSENYQEDSKEE